jgi:endoglycosylceramidase
VAAQASTALPPSGHSEATPLAPLKIVGQHFVDGQGRQVLLRGINMSGDAKVPPFKPLVPSHFAHVQSLGYNVVRLLFIWEAYEPLPGAYDAVYLEYVTSLVRAAAAQGIYSLVDFHQDGMARTALGGCGDGFPAWAVQPASARAVPNNGEACAAWARRLLLDGRVHRAWREFYSGRDAETQQPHAQAARPHYLRMLRQVTAHLRGEPGLLGFDMLNEPWGNEQTEIGPLYAAAAAIIDEVSPEAFVFVSPQALVGGGVQTQLSRPPGPNIVYAPHFYDPAVLALNMWLGNDLSWPFATMQAKAAQWGVPLFLGEYGAPDSTWRVQGYLQTLQERLDAQFISGAQWCYSASWSEQHRDGWNQEDYSVIDAKGSVRRNYVSRALPRAIAGVPQSFESISDPLGRSTGFNFRWLHDPKLGETTLYLPKREPAGAKKALSVVTQGEAVQCTAQDSLLHCSSPIAGMKTIQVAY